MSGYLRSLAAHGVTPGPRLRPVAVPFVASSVARPDPLELDAQIPTAAPPTTLQESAIVTPSISAHHSPRTNDSSSRAPLSWPEAIVLLADPTPRRRVDSSSIQNEQRPIGEPAAPRQRSESVESAPLPARDRSAPVLHQPGRIQPLFMKTPVAPPTGPARTADRRHEESRGRHRSAPDVHIHIGRIELTALTPPAPPRRPAAATKAAMPLDEYLQKRNGRSR
jgi:hypothetical protein